MHEPRHERAVSFDRLSLSDRFVYRRLTARFLCAILTGLISFGLAASRSQAAATEIVVGPFLQYATSDSIWIVWETDDGAQSTVEYGLTAALGSSANGISFVTGGNTRLHQTKLPSLQPDTQYHYRVVTDSVQSAILHFRTPPLPSAEQAFRFIAYSDTQGGPIPNKHTEVVNEGIIDFTTSEFGSNLSDHLAFIIHAGDLVSDGNNYPQWKSQFFDEGQNLFQFIPLYPAIGNHEGNSPYYFDYFRLPENGTPGYLEHWYYIDYSNIRVIAIDTNGAYRIQVQLDWLDGVLADACGNNDIDFVFAHFHHPHHSEMWTPGNTGYVGEIISRMEQFSTDCGKPSVHFFGHTHAYSRGQSRDHFHMMVNVAAGEGGLDWWGGTPPVDYPEYQRSFIDWGFVLMEVEAGADPKFRLRRVSRGNTVEPRDNDVMDDITVRKLNAPPNQPVPLSPTATDGAVEPDGVTLQASTFDDPDGDALLAAHFQLTTTAGDYTSPIVDEWIRAENWYAPPGASGQSNGYFSVNTVTDPNISRLAIPLLEPSTAYYWRVRFRDDGLAWSDWSEEASFTTKQRRDVVLLSEDFDDVTLGPPVEESAWQSDNVWTKTPPPGWTIDDTGVPSIGNPDEGVAEWEGWSFAVPGCWTSAAGNQNRSQFTKASGIIAIADPDEWDDKGDPEALGTYNTYLSTPVIDIKDMDSDSVTLTFDSSWRPEDNQKANIQVAFNGGNQIEIMRWESQAGPHYHPDATNETVSLNVPNGASHDDMVITFGVFDAANDWWWAIDNLVIEAKDNGSPVTVLSEDFDDLLLDPSIDENFGSCTTSLGNRVWSDNPPAGWTLDDSGVPGAGTGNDGVTEWAGWSFTDPEWWTFVAEDQGRSGFTQAWNVIAVADPDEWDDDSHPGGTYDAFLSTPAISLTGILPMTAGLRFDSSWRAEGMQTAVLTVSYDNGSPIELLRWESQAGPHYKPDAVDETVTIPVANPGDASSMVLTFGMINAGNNWWWAIDNLELTGRICGDPATDLDNDLDTDLEDFGKFQICLGTNVEPATSPVCRCSDFSGDGAVNEDDTTIFLQCLTGANVAADTGCDD